MASILNATTSTGFTVTPDNSGSLQLATNNGTTALTIDTSQRVGVNTTSPTATLQVFAQDNQANKALRVAFDGTYYSDITENALHCYNNTLTIETVNNFPMAFKTNATERMRISSDGDVFLNGGTTRYPGSGNTANGCMAESDRRTLFISRSDSYPLLVNRNANDGTIVSIRQDGTEEGGISVSGTTVSYNGGHLSRYAQTTEPKDDSLLKGTVLSNLDEMNEYLDAESNPVSNEQLNKVKVSDVEGDVNVAGVFVNWSHDEAHNVDEINMAMTGDMIIRIAEGVVVQKGDLLMSAGDGTAKPQGDDIVRSKTVAKVTSNHVTCTYADGSYCVPCVLMAC
jgi:hypothetical protein